MAPPSRKHEVIAALPGTCPQIMKRTGVCQDSVNKWIRKLHEAGQIHITSWSWYGCNKTPRYVLGPGRDAQCRLKAYTVAEHCQNYRNRKKKDEAEFVAAKQRAIVNADRIVSSKQAATWLTALL